MRRAFIVIGLMFVFGLSVAFAQERVCGTPYYCQSIGDQKNAKIVKFTSRAAYETWLNAGDRSNCDVPFYSTSSVVEVVCYDGTYIKQCKDDNGICTGG